MNKLEYNSSPLSTLGFNTYGKDVCFLNVSQKILAFSSFKALSFLFLLLLNVLFIVPQSIAQTTNPCDIPAPCFTMTNIQNGYGTINGFGAPSYLQWNAHLEARYYPGSNWVKIVPPRGFDFTTGSFQVPMMPLDTIQSAVRIVFTHKTLGCVRRFTLAVTQGGCTCPDGSFRKTPGAACNDNNPNTSNEVIQADGCTCAAPTVCVNVTNGGSVTKVCNNGTVTLTSTSPVTGGSGAVEYIWLQSTAGCPFNLSQAIPGATNADYIIPAGSVTQTTYFARCARRVGCVDFTGSSNCITVTPNECAGTTIPPTNCNGNTDKLILKGNIDCITIGNTMSISEARDNCGQLPNSSKMLTVPAGATIKAAYLFWSGSGAIDNNVTLNGNSVTAENTKTYYDPAWQENFFGAKANVTNLVQNSGVYTVANLTWLSTDPYCTSNAAYGAWALVVVYESSNLPQATIHINSEQFRMTYPANTYSTTIDCIDIPSNCASNAKLTIVAFEGDNYKGENLSIGGTLSSDPNNFRGQSGPNLDILTFDVANKVNSSTPSLSYSIQSYLSTTIWGQAIEGLFDYVKILKYNNCSNPCDANPITANITGANEVCANQTTTLTASGGTIYKWSNGATSSSITVGAGTYSVSVSNAAGCSQVLSKTISTTPTTITLTNCPQNITLTSSNNNCVAATWTAPSFTANCGTPSVTSNYTSGYCFPVGTTTVTYTATLNGVSKTCSFTVIVSPAPQGSIGDFTFCDNNSNGIFDNGDTPQSGVQVQLCNASNVIIATATTDAQGKYLFPNLTMGIYVVKFPTTITGGKTITTNNPITVNLTAGQNYLDADAGYKPTCNLAINITNKVCNNNGTPSNPNDDTYSFSLTVTGGTGSWSGSYNNSYLGVFQIPATPYGTAIQLGPFPAGSVTSTNTNPPITIPSIDISISVADVQNTNCTKLTVVTSTGTCSTAPLLGSIGDLAYCDNNNNSIFDNGDTPQSGVQIQLCNASNTVIATATTDAQGKYLFPNLIAGIYIVKFPATITGGKTITTQSTITVNLSAGQNYLDADGGYYKPTTCPDGTPKKVVGSACNDNNPNTTNDKIQADGCSCAGTPVNNNDFCTNPTANVTTGAVTITISGITTSSATIQVFNSSWASVFNQTATTSTVVIPNLPNGTYYVKVTVLGTGGSWPAKCEQMVTVTISGGGNNLCPDGTPKKTPGTACNDNNPNTTNDVIQADGCGCAGTPVVPTCPDGTPKKTPGTACNDNNPNTTNDVIQADGCGCAGTPSGGSDFCTNPNANVTTGAGTITISGITTSSAVVQIFNSSWVSVYNQQISTSSVTIPNLPAGTYQVKVTVLGAGGSWPMVCEKSVSVTVGGGTGNTCPDGSPKKTPGTACNDNNPNTTNDVIQADGCGCAGTTPPNCNETRNNTITKSCVSGKPVLTGTALAGYEYMWLSSTSACPNDPNQAIAGATSQNLYLTANVTQTTYFSRCARPIGCTTWGAITESNCVTVTPADCGTATGGCDALSVVGNSNGTISIAGMGSYTSQVIIFNSQWQPVFNQQYNTSTATIPLKNGGYIVKIQLYNTNGTWQFVCEKMFQNITVTGGVASLASGRLVLDLTAAAELHKVKLVWANNTGYKNDYFEVEKLNEKSSIFEKIALINSQNGDKMESYTAFDEQPTEGDNIYRINLIGTDGTTKVSNQSVVKFNKAYDFRIFPNPASDYIDVDLKQYEGKTVTLQVYNSFGKVISTQQVERASSLPVHLDLNPIAAGQYLIRVTSEGRKAAVKKFVIQN